MQFNVPSTYQAPAADQSVPCECGQSLIVKTSKAGKDYWACPKERGWCEGWHGWADKPPVKPDPNKKRKSTYSSSPAGGDNKEQLDRIEQKIDVLMSMIQQLQH